MQMNLLPKGGRRLAGFLLPVLLLSGGPPFARTGSLAAGLRQEMQQDQMSLKEAIAQLESRFKVVFGYESSLVENQVVKKGRWHTLDNLEEAVTQLLAPLKLTYEKVSPAVYVIRPARTRPVPVRELDTSRRHAPPEGSVVIAPGTFGTLNASTRPAVAVVRVSGAVTDLATGQPLPGVNVTIKGTTQGTATDGEGQFSLTVPDENATLVFSFIGYVSEEVVVGSRTRLDIGLAPDTKALGEVVVVGYGTQQRKDLTGSIATVKAEQIRQVPVISLDQALQGRAAGVQVMQSNGAPGGAVQVQIRGVNSTGSGTANQPLYVLDGVPLYDDNQQQAPSAGSNGSPQNNTGSPIANLNPNDIESIQILKDASAAAIYGARAANGVVVITTKTGKAGKPRFNADYYYGVQALPRELDLINGTEGMMLRKEALLNTRSDFTRNIPAEMFNPYSLGDSPDFGNVNWQRELFRTAPIQDFNLSATGGTERVRYAASGNYFDQQGIFINSAMKRLGTRVNLDVDATDKLTFGLRSAVSGQWGNTVRDANPFQGNVIGALLTSPYQPAYNADGSYWGPLNQPSGVWDGRNPVFEAREFTLNLRRNRYTGNVFGAYELVKGLTFRSSFGVDYTTIDQKFVNPAIPRGPAFTIAGPDLGANNTMRVRLYNANTLNWVADQTLTYSATFARIHQLTALAGFSAQSFTTRNYASGGDGSLNPALQLLVNNGQNVYGGEGYTQAGLVSQFARINYSLMDRYLLTGTVRRDGSSRFGPTNRYGVFPSVSAGWRVSEESFLRNAGVVSDLKLRASWGLTGNQEIGNFGYVSRVSSANYVFGTTGVGGGFPSNLANEALRWEANEQTDVGLDLGLLGGRFGVTVDYYVKNANDLLVGIPVPGYSGFTSQVVNLGKVRNQGWEFSLNAQNLTGAFKWNTSLNFSTLENRVVDLGVNAAGGVNEFFGFTSFTSNAPHNRTREGDPIGSFYGLRTDGIVQTYEEGLSHPTQTGVVLVPGDVKYVDTNGDGEINFTAGDKDDRVNLGSPFPKFFGGITNEFSYRNFSLNVFANFVSGNKVFNHARMMLEDFGDQAGSVNQLRRWTAENPGNAYPRMVLGNAAGYNRNISDRWIEDGSFLRIRNVTLAYSLPAALAGKARMQSVRVYASVNNALTFTRYTGWDPEVNSAGSNVLSAGTDLGGYPVARSFVAGINLGF